jgi:membrane-associated phospholipid phosphatase
VFNSILRFIARHVPGFFGPLAAFLTMGMLVAAGAVVLFGLIAEAVEEGITQTFDETALHWFQTHRSEFFNKIMLEITTLGTGVVLIMIVLIASIFLWQTQHKWSVYLLLLGTFGGKLLNTALKAFYNRDRPSVVEWVTEVHSTSFPSGHAMSAMVVYGSVAYLVGRLDANRGLRHTTWAVAAVVILAIGISRMYLGVHYPSDVIAGFIAGLAWLGFVVACMRALQFFAKRRPETRAEEHDLHVDDDVNPH